MNQQEKTKIIKEFHEMKPSEAFKKIDFAKFPKDVREKIKSDLKNFSDDSLDLLKGSSTYKKWIDMMADLYPAVLGIKIEKIVPKQVVVPEKTEEQKVDYKQKTEELNVRLGIIKKMLQKTRDSDKKGELRVRMKIIEKMVSKTKEEEKESKKNSVKKNKKSLGGFLFGAAAGLIAGQFVDFKLTTKKIRFDLGGTIYGNKKYLYSITFNTITDDSAIVGDFESNGFEVEEMIDELQDILQDASYKYGIHEKVSDNSWESTSPDMNHEYFEKGIEKYFNLHVKNIDGSDISKEESDFITQKLNEGKQLNWDSENAEWFKDGGVIHSEKEDGVLVFKADTKGGKYSVEVRDNNGRYTIYEYTNGSLNSFGTHNNNELLRHKLIDTIIGSKKIDSINYYISIDTIGVKDYIPASEKLWNILNGKDFNEWYQGLSAEQKSNIDEKVKQRAIEYVKGSGYKEDDSTIGSFYSLFRKNELLKQFHENKGLVMLRDGGDVKGKLSRSQKQYNKEVDDYKWFIVDLKNKRAISGWEFEEDAKDALSDYNTDENFKVVHEKTLSSMGVENPKEQFKKMGGGGYFTSGFLCSSINFKNEYGSATLEIDGEFKAIKDLGRVRDLPEEFIFSIDDAEKLALISENRYIQISFDSSNLRRCAVIVHDSASTGAWAKIKELNFKEGIDAQEELRISPSGVPTSFYKAGGKVSRIKDSEINVGNRFGLPNGEVVEIKDRFIESKYIGDDRVVVYTRSSDSETHEGTVKELRIFLNNFQAQPISKHTEEVLGEKYWTKYSEGGKITDNFYSYVISSELGTTFETMGEIYFAKADKNILKSRVLQLFREKHPEIKNAKYIAQISSEDLEEKEYDTLSEVEKKKNGGKLEKSCGCPH